MDALKDRNAPEDVPRIENLQELVRAVAEAMDAGESFTEFLDAAALVSDADSFEGKPGVTLIGRSMRKKGSRKSGGWCT
jgi:DNA helicase-2/ATP-dependent DNA helicase PcrA